MRKPSSTARAVLVAAGIAAAFIAAFGCETTNTPSKPKKEQSPYTGTFYLTFVPVEWNCSYVPSLNGAFLIMVTGDSLDFASHPGTWDETSAHGYVKYSFGTECPLHNPPTRCATCMTFSFDFTFVTVDSLTGTFGTGSTYASCSPDSCHIVYSVSGKRI